MVNILIKVSDILVEFSNATKSKDIECIQNLLSEDGTFEIQDKELKTVEVNKNNFIDWYSQKLECNTIFKIVYDQCLYCNIGKRIVLFNDGQFPRTAKSDSEHSKTGLLLDIKDSKITNISFCFGFLKTENDYVFECKFKNTILNTDDELQRMRKLLLLSKNFKK